MGLSNKRKKRTKAEQKERRQRNGGSPPGAPLNLFMAVTEARLCRPLDRCHLGEHQGTVRQQC